VNDSRRHLKNVWSFLLLTMYHLRNCRDYSLKFCESKMGSKLSTQTLNITMFYYNIVIWMRLNQRQQNQKMLAYYNEFMMIKVVFYYDDGQWRCWIFYSGKNIDKFTKGGLYCNSIHAEVVIKSYFKGQEWKWATHHLWYHSYRC
jgi:hypothetical protein